MLIEDGVIKLGAWLPDLPVYGNPGLVEAKNTIPVDGSYGQVVAMTATGETALPLRPQGAFAAIDSAGDPELYAGTATKLYERIGTAWTDRAGAVYTTSTTGYWRFSQFETFVVATNFNDTPQARTIGSVANFAALATSGSAPRARQVGVIGRFLMLGDIDDGSAQPATVQWSGIDTPRAWPTPNTIGARTVQAGKQALNAAYGAVTAISNGQFYGLVFQQKAVTRFTYIGGDAVFQVQEIDVTHGCWAPQSMVQVGDAIYFLAIDGFYMTNGQVTMPIGTAKIDRWFFANLNQPYRERITASFDYATKCIYWSYPSNFATSGSPDRMVCFNILEGRWTWAENVSQLLFQSFTTGYTLDQLDTLYSSLDDITITLDSAFWSGGTPIVQGFVGNALGSSVGMPLAASFETGESQQNPFGYTFIRGISPRVIGNPTSLTVSLATRANLDNESRTFGSARSRTARTGVCDFRVNGRFISAKLDIVGGFERALELGVDLELSDQV